MPVRYVLFVGLWFPAFLYSHPLFFEPLDWADRLEWNSQMDSQGCAPVAPHSSQQLAATWFSENLADGPQLFHKNSGIKLNGYHKLSDSAVSWVAQVEEPEITYLENQEELGLSKATWRGELSVDHRFGFFSIDDGHLRLLGKQQSGLYGGIQQIDREFNLTLDDGNNQRSAVATFTNSPVVFGYSGCTTSVESRISDDSFGFDWQLRPSTDILIQFQLEQFEFDIFEAKDLSQTQGQWTQMVWQGQWQMNDQWEAFLGAKIVDINQEGQIWTGADLNGTGLIEPIQQIRFSGQLSQLSLGVGWQVTPHWQVQSSLHRAFLSGQWHTWQPLSGSGFNILTTSREEQSSDPEWALNLTIGYERPLSERFWLRASASQWVPLTQEPQEAQGGQGSVKESFQRPPGNRFQITLGADL